MPATSVAVVKEMLDSRGRLPAYVATAYIPTPAVNPTRPPFNDPSRPSFITRAFSFLARAPSVIPRRATASAWHPVLPD